MNFLTIHFLNVGHGDCTIIEFPDHLTMVDINNSKSLDDDTAKELGKSFGVTDTDWMVSRVLGSRPDKIKEYEEALTDPVDFYISKFGRQSLFRYIQTHPDMDHMSGLYRLGDEGIETINFWDTKHSVEKSDDPDDWEDGQYDIRDWQTYLKLRKSKEKPKALFFTTGDKHEFFHGDGIRIWAPSKNSPEIDEDSEVNALSYVLRIQFGECSIMLGGDAPESYWKSVYDIPDFTYPKVHLLKAPHHGRKSGYHWQSVKAMSPDFTVVSVGELKKKDDAFSGYERWSEKGCYSTRFEGNIKAQCWEDGDVWLYDCNGERLKGD